jgi:putative OPT family oligopeptide transporter
MREITVKAVVLGIALSALLAAANAYLGLKVGMTVSASIPAAVISMGFLRLFRRSNILENNLVQTAASAGESLAAGVIFTIPALVLMGHWEGFRYFEVTALAGIGGMLGVLFSIPLRRALILEERLRFPEGVATAEVLKAGDTGGAGLRHIAVAAVVAGGIKLAQSGLKIAAGSMATAWTAGRSLVPFGCNLSPALVGVGYIVGLNIAVLVFGGGAIAWLVGIPIFSAIHGLPDGKTGYDAALAIWTTKIRYIGVGAMVIGGLWALLALLKPIGDGIRASMRAHARNADGEGLPQAEQDIPFRSVLIMTALCLCPLVLVYLRIIDRAALGTGAGTHAAVIALGLVLAVVAGFLFSAVAGYMAGLVGSSQNPVSGVTIATILLTALLLSLLLGVENASSTVAAATAIVVGSVVCCAAAISGDNLQDLKAGHMLGATPYKQQIMQMIGVGVAAVTLAPVLSLLYRAYGLGTSLPRAGMDPAEALSAPQATLMHAVARGVFERDLEWGMIIIGMVVAILIIFADNVLKARGSAFRMPVLAVAVGIYLPLELTVPILLGGLLASAIQRRAGTPSTNGLLFASGLIAGEALMGILLAIPFAAAQSTDVIAMAPEGFEYWAGIIGVAALAGVVRRLYRVARS